LLDQRREIDAGSRSRKRLQRHPEAPEISKHRAAQRTRRRVRYYFTVRRADKLLVDQS
jgi:hypothetical protein